ncbi:PaaX family transcriptional regulator C-terminal domain-containing protein [Phytomonospora endophytica]|uniref:Phenylacetic acid degradation operon negative regulatory protein n=1 Tax=Phytomonospora endophytica TaxID=714109 RepID=A0A841FMM0_9ACTN|nr:PaaX family transcriptional regulator C-terminal domain-containing protein [Phytomonospora endophytica]MBB6035048.1 phenylacetic acid degradation operon negative regulatory protein [Phytomonospora endophytica]GIG68302.1 putative repressor in the phenylacetic acid catabolism [Phytomonospora endophytica]
MTTRPEIPTRLLVHALVRADGTVDAEQLYTVAGLLDMTDQQVRLCVKRLVAEGLFTQDGRGRRAVLRAVADPAGAIAPDVDYVRHAYRQDAGLAPWDGRWHLFAFAIPERRRTARDAFRAALLHLGATAVQGGLYVAANPIAPLVEAQARQLDVLDQLTSCTTTDLRLGDHIEPTELAAALWPLTELADRHRTLAAFAADCLNRVQGPTPPTGGDARGDTARLDDAERLTMAVQLATVFTDAMRPDPLLPPELLPPDWPGREARRLAADCWTRLRVGRPATGPRLFALYEEAFEAAGDPSSAAR